MKQYAERDIMSLDESGGYYCRHISSMTSEQLHSKSDIAAELGHRDMVIAELLEALQNLETAANTLKYCNDRRPENVCSALQLLDQRTIEARAAIAKASGE